MGVAADTVSTHDEHGTVALNKTDDIAVGAAQRKNLAVRLADGKDVGEAALEEATLAVYA